MTNNSMTKEQLDQKVVRAKNNLGYWIVLLVFNTISLALWVVVAFNSDSLALWMLVIIVMIVMITIAIRASYMTYKKAVMQAQLYPE